MRIEETTSTTVGNFGARSSPESSRPVTCRTRLRSWLVPSVVNWRSQWSSLGSSLRRHFGELSSANREFVQNLAESAGAGSELEADTPVLSLIGTHGQEEDWRDCRKSKGHVDGRSFSTSGRVEVIDRQGAADMGQLGRVLGASKYRPFSYRILKDFLGQCCCSLGTLHSWEWDKSLRPIPAPQLVILPSRRRVDWMDAVFATPPEVDRCPNSSKPER